MKILVAVAWPYVNGDIHVGHLGGYLLPADIIARLHKMKGNDVLMVSGSDCYGTPITIEADKKKVAPSKIIEKYHKLDLELFRLYDLSYNLYTKTTTENHKEVVHEIFISLLKNNCIEKGTMKQYYSVDDKQYLPDRYVEGICSHCKAKGQRSDQCENCGRWLADGELEDPKSKLSGSKVIMKDTEHYFLVFERLHSRMREYLDSRKDIWKKWVWAEAEGWLREGLKKRAITRDIDWGIDIPVDKIKKLSKDKQLSSYKGKKIYVWFEAVIGYLSASKEWSKRLSGQMKGDKNEIIFSHYKKQSRSWKDFWLNKTAKHYYFMGQDNLVFHTLMWPAQLMGVDQKYTLPENVVVNKFMHYEGKKFSKSRNWTIDSKKIAEVFGVDSVRYYITANLPENKESNFTWKGFVDAVNNELVANLGNFINRALSFIERHFDGKVPSGEIENEVQFKIMDTLSDTEQLLESMHITEGLQRIFMLVSFANKYFDKSKVWNVVKEDKKKAAAILNNCAQIIEALRVLLHPFLPHASEKLGNMLGQEKPVYEVGKDNWKFEKLEAGTKLKKVEILFKKIEKELAEKQIKELKS